MNSTTNSMVLFILVMLAVVVAATAFIVWKIDSTARLITNHLPKKVSKKDGFTCTVSFLPGRRQWIVSNMMDEQELLDAFKEASKAYTGWVPDHRLIGRGGTSRWQLTLRRPSRKSITPQQVRTKRHWWNRQWNPLKAIRIGRDLDRHAVSIPANRHTLVVGLTGSGKGSVMAAIVAELMPCVRDGLVDLYGIDLKGGVELGMYGSVFERHHAYDLDSTVLMLETISEELARRLELMRGNTRDLKPSDENPRIYILIDEAAELFKGSSREEKQRADRIKSLLDSILRRGRAAGVVVVAFTQDPRMEAMPLRARFPQRIGMLLTDEAETSMQLGAEAVERGAWCWRISPTMPGSGYFWDAERKVCRYFRAAYYTDDDLRMLAGTETPEA